MATTDLKKFLVFISAGATEAFINKYVTEGDSRDTSYDDKVVFLAGTNEIFTNGYIFGLNKNADIASLQDALEALTEYVGDSLEVTDTSTVVGYLKRYATEHSSIVTCSGHGLSVTSSEDSDTGQMTYNIDIDSSIWTFEGTIDAVYGEDAVTTINNWFTENTDKVKDNGTVVVYTKSDGTAVVYAYNGTSDDSDDGEWSIIGAAQGVSSVDETVSNGVNLTYSNGVVGVNVETGEVKSGDNTVVSGGTVYTYVTNVQEELEQAISDVKAVADTAIQTGSGDDYISVVKEDTNLTITTNIDVIDEQVFNYISDNLWEVVEE